MGKRTELIIEDLISAGADLTVVEAARKSLSENLPSKVYIYAVWLVGIAAVLLAAGGIVIPALGKEAPDAIWNGFALCAGGLLGIFSGQKST